MILKSFEVNKIFDSKSSFFLFYGENKGLKDLIIEKHIIEKFDGSVEKYEENDILNDEDSFFSNIFNKSFFVEKKIIIINRVTDKISRLIKELSLKDFPDAKIILNSNSLEKKSKLRSLFEKEKNLVVIPVYPDDNKTLFTIASNFFKNEKKIISNETINIIVEKSNGDRGNLQNELNKILIFSKDRDKIKQEDIEKLVNLTENFSVSELTDNCLSKNLKRTVKILNENKFNSEDCMLIIRTLLNKSKRIMNLREKFDQTKNLEKTLGSYRPPIFWKDKDLVKKQVINWDLNSVKKLIFKIAEIEILLKKNNYNSLNILYDFIISTSQTSNN